MIHDCVQFPISNVKNPIDRATVYKDYYWVVTPDGYVLSYRGSMQCNKNEEITKKLRDKLYPTCGVDKLTLFIMELH